MITLWTAFSKRYRVLEPYVRISGSAPFAASSAYDNCGNKAILSDVAPVNCDGAWKGQTGYKPSYEAALLLGAELVAALGAAQDCLAPETGTAARPRRSREGARRRSGDNRLARG